MIELEPERHDELAALIAEHMREGGETREAARWSARAAYWAGHSRPRESLRLWQAVSDLTDELEEDEEVAALAINSRLLQLSTPGGWGWSSEEQARLGAEAEEIATRHGDLHSLALLRVATSARPGLAARGEGMAGRGRTRRSRSPTSPATRTCRSRSAPPAPTPTSAPPTSTASRRCSTKCSSWRRETAASAPASCSAARSPGR